MLSLSYILGESQHVLEHYSSVEPSFSIFFSGSFFNVVPVYSGSSMYEYVVVEYQNREHSKAQQSTARSHLHKAANQVRADQSTYQKKYVHGCYVRFVFLEHGALGICKSPVCT